MSESLRSINCKLYAENKRHKARIAELEEMLSVAEKLISTNMQVFEYLSGDNRETMGAITEKMQAFDAFLVNHAYVAKGDE